MIQEIGKIQASSGENLLRMWITYVDFFRRPVLHHSHIQFEISLILKGTGEYHVGDMAYPMEPGDMFVFTSREAHYITQARQTDLVLLNLQFEPRYLFGSSKDSLSESNILLCFSHSPRFQNRIPAENTGALPALFQQIRQELETPKAEANLMVKSLLNLFLIRLIREHHFTDDIFSVTRQHMHAIRNALEYIEDNISAPLSLSAIAQTARMSPNYFSTVFKRFVGISLWDYITGKRIELAVRLLLDENTRHTVLDIALQCGFNSTASFNKAFRNQTGITPSEYRSKADGFMI